MSIAQETVNRALYLIGVKSEVREETVTMRDECFKHLRKVLAMLEKKSIILSETLSDGTVQTVVIPTLITDELNEPLAASAPLEKYLALDFAATARIPVDPRIVAEKSLAYNELAHMFRQSIVPLRRPYRYLHKGQGHRAGRYRNQWFGGDRLSSDSNESN